MKKMKYAANDYSLSMLPKNRFAQFKDIISHEWRTILLMGLVTLLFALPYIARLIVEYMVLSGVISSFDASMSEAERNAVLFSYSNGFYLIDIPLFVLFSFSLMGNSRVLKELCWGKSSLFKADFFRGVKENIRVYLLGSVILSIILYIIKYTSGILTSVNNDIPALNSLLKGVGYGGLFAILVPMIMWSLSEYNYYSLSFKKTIANAWKFYLHFFFLSLPFVLIIFAYFTLTLILDPLILALITAVLTFVTPLLHLGWRLFTLYLFDENVNLNNYPEIYRKGLSKQTKNNENESEESL